MNRVLAIVSALAVVGALAGTGDAAPVSYWTFDGNALDSGTAGNHGTLNGGAGYSSVVPAQIGTGQSLDLNGSSQWMSVAPPTGTVSGSYTVSAWARVVDNSTNTIFATRRPTDAGFDMKLQGGNLIHGDIGNGTSWIATNADATFNYSHDKWHHIAYVVTSTSVDVYADGVRHGGRTWGANTPLLWDANHHINIGRYNAGSEYFSRYIDDVAVWNSALSPTQIAALAGGTSPLTVETVADATSGHNGAVRYIPIDDDLTSDISPAKTYTHKVDFGSSGAANVNGVVFDAAGPGPLPGDNGTSNVPSNHGGNNNHGIPLTEGVASLFQDMTYGANPSIIMLDGLTPGQAYDTRLYVRNWEAGTATNDRSQLVQYDTNGDGAYDRSLRINPDNSSELAPDFDSDNHQPYALSYVFVAESDKLTIQLNQLGGGTYHLYGLTNEETDRLPIETLFSTGLDANGDPLTPGTPDPHYALLAGAAQGTTALAITNHPAWAPNDAGSGFIGVANPGTTSVAGGSYNYQTTFDLTGFDPSAVELIMTIYTDNSVDDIILNGVSTGLTAAGFGYNAGKTHMLTSGFQQGINTLEFQTTNNGSGPAGFRVDLGGTALPSVIPEPMTMLAVGLSLTGLGGYVRRRRMRT